MRSSLTLAFAVACCTPTLLSAVACEPVKLASEMPGPRGCGMRDPTNSGPSTMSVAQNTVLKNNGMPLSAEPNEHGGRSWMFVRSTGSVFGESEAADVFIFDKDGLLVSQKTELRKHVGK